MKRKSLVALAVVACLSMGNADTPNLEQELYEENQESQLEDNYIQSAILAQKAVRIGKETLQSLKTNLAFIQRLENDSEFVKCVVHKANLTKLNELANGAKKLLDKGKISQQDYNQYIAELNSQKSNLKQKISSTCDN
jgi:hypothetical protein